jgi:AGZA family xanthine/uracil permease-like MFS transporter
MIERLFKVKEIGSSYPKEILGGIVTFMTMAYIISLQPTLMSSIVPGWVEMKGETFFALMVAVCLMSAFATLVMAFAANYPIALAPGMGENILFATMIVMVAGTPENALGVIFYSGVLFFLLTLFRVREKIIKLISPSLKSSIAVGIGLFILALGALNAFLKPAINAPPADYDLFKWEFAFGFDWTIFLVFVINLAIIGALYFLRIPGGLLLGMIIGAVVASFAGLVSVGALAAPVPSIGPVLLKIDFIGALAVHLLPWIIIFTFVNLFDTLGTLIGVSQKAGFTKPDGTLPRVRGALMADAVGTMSGALVGLSTVLSYIESSAGVASGARTGLASVVTSILFLAAMFFTPLWAELSAAVIIGPVLIAVGLIMMTEVRKIAWRDWTEMIPALGTILLMAGTKAIHYGLAAGFILYPICKLLGGKVKELNWLNWVMAVVCVGMVALIFTAT